MFPDKKELRKLLLEQRAQLPEELRKSRSELICRHLIDILDKLPLDRDGAVFTFMPFGDEVDVRPVARWCWQQGYAIAAPRVIRGSGRQLCLHLVRGEEQLESGLWGIAEPREDLPVADASAIAAVLVPGVGFDPEGGRLGYGGGYYDRLFARWRAAGLTMPLKLAPAFSVQLQDRLPLESHDERMDLIITESGQYGMNRSDTSP